MRRGMITRFMVIFIALALVAFVPFKAKADDELEPESTIYITSQPADYLGPVGEMATFTVEAEGEGLTYQWQVLKSSGWANCSIKDGAKKATLSLAITQTVIIPKLILFKSGIKIIPNIIASSQMLMRHLLLQMKSPSE